MAAVTPHHTRPPYPDAAQHHHHNQKKKKKPIAAANGSSSQLQRGSLDVVVPIRPVSELDSGNGNGNGNGNGDDGDSESRTLTFRGRSSPGTLVSDVTPPPRFLHLAHSSSVKTASRTRPRSKSFDSSLPADFLDPPSRLINSFLQRQAASGNLCLDMDMKMMENAPAGPLSSVQEDYAKPFDGIVVPSSSTGNDAAQQQSLPTVKADCKNVSSTGECCSPSSSDCEVVEEKPSRSRLSDRRSATRFPSGQKAAAVTASSGAASKKSEEEEEEEEDDPLKDEDVPESLRKPKCSIGAGLQWVAFVVIMGAMVCSLAVPAMARKSLWSMALWKWTLLVLLLLCGRLVSGWVISLVVMIIERNFLFLRKRVLYFVYALRAGMQNCVWLTFAMLAWRLVFNPKLQSTVHHSTSTSGVVSYITKLLNCLLVSALLWLIKVFLVKVLASSFHVSTYFERIQESLFGQWLLETLSLPMPPAAAAAMDKAEKQKVVEEMRKAGMKLPAEILLLPALDLAKEEGETIQTRSGVIGSSKSGGVMVGGIKKSGGVLLATTGAPPKKSHQLSVSEQKKSKEQQKSKEGVEEEDEGMTIDHLHRLNPDNVSAWNMKRLMNFVRYGGIYTISHVIDQTTTAGSNEQDVEIQTAWQAKEAAKSIFRNVAKPGARYIERNDLLRFMREKDVEKALPLFEGAVESGTISKTALKNFAVHVVRERRALAASLNDTKTAVKKLERIIDGIVGVVILIICLLILGITTSHLLLVVSSQLVLVAFIFGNTCKTIFEDIIFLFVMHPFDVGDRCVVDGMQLVVEEMSILSTVFVKGDNERIWYPNSVLATMYIFNYSRTPDTSDSFDFCIDAHTPSDKISQLKERISKYLASKPNHWTRNHQLIVKGIENNNKMNMQLKLNHTINFTDDSERQIRKTNLILDVNNILQELEIGYGLPPQEVHLLYTCRSLPPN